jgi:hypothetical protein
MTARSSCHPEGAQQLKGPNLFRPLRFAQGDTLVYPSLP